MADPHRVVAGTAVRALRFVPGDQADALLAAQLSNGMHQVVGAIGHRDAAVGAHA